MNRRIVKEFLGRHDFLDYCQRVIRLARKKEFREAVSNIGHEKKGYYHIEKLGNKNKGKVIYLYEEKLGFSMGFFAIYRFILESCWFAENYGFVPVFHWSDDCVYGNNGVTINNSDDAFGQFFLQPTEISYNDAMESNAVIISNMGKRDQIREMIFGKESSSLGYEYDENYLRLMGEYAKKYVRINTELEKTLKDEVNRVLGKKKTLAVHIRIKGFENVNGHPKTKSLNDYIDEIKNTFGTGDYEQIFIATGETGTIEKLIEVFGEKIVYFDDILRVEDGNSLFADSERNNHKYLLGYEVFRDAYAMSCCDGFIAGISQISFGTIILKYSRGEEFNYKKIFNMGVNRTNYTTDMQYREYKKRYAK